MTHQLVIRGGTVVDGTGGSARDGDVAVDGGRITAVGVVVDAGVEEIDATSCLVSPGWVDVHTHYDGQATWDPLLTPSCWHGVTTAVMGNCGVGFAPVEPAAAYLIVLKRLQLAVFCIGGVPGSHLQVSMSRRRRFVIRPRFLPTKGKFWSAMRGVPKAPVSGHVDAEGRHRPELVVGGVVFLHGHHYVIDRRRHRTPEVWFCAYGPRVNDADRQARLSVNATYAAARCWPGKAAHQPFTEHGWAWTNTTSMLSYRGHDARHDGRAARTATRRRTSRRSL